jgi:hypothetical protein
MRVDELILLLQKCPPEFAIELYYDGSPRLVPNMAYLYTDRGDNVIVALGEHGDIYSVKDGDPSIIFSPRMTTGDKNE